jgi:uncharacterized protein (TIGR00299 family) protein
VIGEALGRSVTLIDSQTAGISGDMLLAALIDIGADVEEITNVLRLIPPHFPRCKALRLEYRDVMKHGFRACSVEFVISETGGETKAEDLIESAHEIAKESNLSDRARAFASAAIQTLIEVESKLHGVELPRTHLHEAGSTDTLADVFGVAAACDSLNILQGEVIATPVAVGGGGTSFSHGTLAVPSPAALEIARRNGIPILGGPETTELATPTGMSLLASITKNFIETYPPMIPERVGYGAGKKELVKAPNIVRIVLGKSVSSAQASEKVEVLETNLDDVSGEVLAHALQLILESGAKDAWITPALFKKNRPGHVLHAICDLSDTQKIADIMFRETGTFGVRFQQWDRLTLQREISVLKLEVAGREFDVRVKLAKDASGAIVRAKPEFEDIRSIADAVAIPAREISDLVMGELTQRRVRTG